MLTTLIETSRTGRKTQLSEQVTSVLEETQKVLNGELKLDEVSDEAKELVKMAYAQSSALRVLYLQQNYISNYEIQLLNKTFVEQDLNRVLGLKKQLESVKIAYNDTTRAISAKTTELRKA